MSLQVFRLGGVERFCESRGVNVAASPATSYVHQLTCIAPSMVVYGSAVSLPRKVLHSLHRVHSAHREHAPCSRGAPGSGYIFIGFGWSMRTDVRSFLQPIESRSLVERYEKDHNRPAQHATSGDTFEASAKSETRPLWLRGFPWSRTPRTLWPTLTCPSRPFSRPRPSRPSFWPRPSLVQGASPRSALGSH